MSECAPSGAAGRAAGEAAAAAGADSSCGGRSGAAAGVARCLAVPRRLGGVRRGATGRQPVSNASETLVPDVPSPHRRDALGRGPDRSVRPPARPPARAAGSPSFLITTDSPNNTKSSHIE